MNPEQSHASETLFLYPRGALVRWAAHPDVRWRILWRRYTEPEVLAGYVQYRLEPVEATIARTVGAGAWAYETDVTPWPETP